jgi:hypothetical protein
MKIYLLVFIIFLAGCEKDPLPPASTPAVETTLTVSTITRTSAVCSGNATGDYGAVIIEKGICWGLSPNPTVSGNKIIAGNSTGIFFATLTGLTPAKTYYFRAYAVNQVGISYGESISFRTLN